ncbi:MAG: hypothetical protein PHT49_07700 [Desulfovibrionales bacterium]|nr:hypothetical protein [Desulfovibrionales bacterium]
MNQEALDILQRLTEDASIRRQKRLTQLLKPAEAEYAEGWFMCVPKCFNDSLDIRLTERIVDGHLALVWTQGSAFSFSEGDILYDTRNAYKVWSEALKSISLGVQVRQALAAGAASEGNGRSPGSVTFEILKPDKRRSKLVGNGYYTLSQDDFVRFLIAGPSEGFAARLKEAPTTNSTEIQPDCPKHPAG